MSNGDISSPRHMNAKRAKFYTKTKNGDYIVKKQYGNKTVLVGRFSDEETAQMIVSLCKAVNWDLDKVNRIIDENKIKPKNYSFVNGYYTVQKMIDGERVIFHRFKHEAQAIYMVHELRRMGWDKSNVDLILDEMSLN